MLSSHLIFCRPLLLLPSIFSSIRVFSNKLALCIMWPKDWSFSFNISPSIEYSGLISFRNDWLNLLGSQGTLKSLLQHHSIKAPIRWCSAFFMVQLSHLYRTTGNTIALTLQTFVDKVMSLLFNMLSGFVIAFLPKSKCLWFHGCSRHSQWFWSSRKWTLSLFPHFPLLFARSDGTRWHDPISFLNVDLSQLFLSLLSLSSRGSLVPLYFLPLEWYHLHIWGYWCFSQLSWFQLVIHTLQRFSWYTLHIS